MRITLHDYVTDPLLTQKDGVNLAHENIAALLRGVGQEQLLVRFHDFNRLLTDQSYALEILSNTDCVVSNVGPHAQYYFYLRERFDLDFRILRDVRTAIWSSYLLQEHLCRPYLRDGDVLMVASHYTRAIYEKLFPHLRSGNTVRCYPLTVEFPAELPARRQASYFTLGYIGRLSEDKNFSDIVDLLVMMNKRQPGHYKLLACGDIHSTSCHPDAVRALILDELGEGDYFEYLPPRANGHVWELYRRFDAMLFPSTSNLETLGRVLVEASYAGVPVVCGDHAAAAELMPSSSLCRVSYVKRKTFSAHFDHLLGRVDLDDMAKALSGDDLRPADCHLEYMAHAQKFTDLLSDMAMNRKLVPEQLTLTDSQQRFVESLHATLPDALDKETVDALMADLMPWISGLQARGTQIRKQYLDWLVSMSKHPARTERYISTSAQTNADLTCVGGIDIELCHVIGFYPEFFLADSLP